MGETEGGEGVQPGGGGGGASLLCSRRSLSHGPVRAQIFAIGTIKDDYLGVLST